MFTSMNFLVLSYLIFSGKQILIQHDAMNTKVGCHLGIIKQFLQHLKDNCLIKILPEVHKLQKLQTRIIHPKIKHNLGAVDHLMEI